MSHDPTGVWEDLRVPLSTSRPGGANDPTYDLFRNNGAGSTGVDAWSFPAGSERELFFDTQFQHAILEGMIPRAHLHFSPKSNNAGNVTFGLEFTFANVNSVFPLTQIVEVTVAVAANSDRKHLVADFGALTSMAGLKISAVFVGRVYRKNVVGYPDAVALVSSDLHVKLDAFGSTQEFIK